MAPRRLAAEDAAALIGLTAVLEGHLLVGDLDPHVVDSLNRHLRRTGLVGTDAGAAELRQALARLNRRLRYAVGEHDEPPTTGEDEVVLHFGFPTEVAAGAFAAAVQGQGQVPSLPVAVDGRAYDGEVSWQVDVRTTELPQSDGFDAHLARLSALAAEHAGQYGGWGGR